MADRSKLGKRNRRAGHKFERDLMHEYRNLGYEDCVTARNDSRILDSCGIDLSRIPFFPQAKYGYPSMSVNNYIKLFEKMAEGLKDNKVKEDYPLVIHHRRGRKKYEDLVIIPRKDFFKLIKTLKSEN